MGDEVGPTQGQQGPFPIFRLKTGADRYMLYDVNVVSWLRKEHHILGVLTGSLPLLPQQNVFLGLPLELMPEEARLLVDEGIVYVVDDGSCHLDAANAVPRPSLHRYMEQLRIDGQEAASTASQQKAERSAKARARKEQAERGEDSNDMPTSGSGGKELEAEDANLFGDGSQTLIQSTIPQTQSLGVWSVTPPTASVFIQNPPASSAPSPKVDASSYALFKHLHSKGYYLSPGLRFGCQFMAYPGDPLRYHSHFLSVSAEWKEDIELLELLGGGRLGTGVKKGFLVGGLAPGEDAENSDARTFCIEWAGM